VQNEQVVHLIYAVHAQAITLNCTSPHQVLPVDLHATPPTQPTPQPASHPAQLNARPPTHPSQEPDIPSYAGFSPRTPPENPSHDGISPRVPSAAWGGGWLGVMAELSGGRGWFTAGGVRDLTQVAGDRADPGLLLRVDPRWFRPGPVGSILGKRVRRPVCSTAHARSARPSRSPRWVPRHTIVPALSRPPRPSTAATRWASRSAPACCSRPS
jgi:hypothetical protein